MSGQPVIQLFCRHVLAVLPSGTDGVGGLGWGGAVSQAVSQRLGWQPGRCSRWYVFVFPYSNCLYELVCLLGSDSLIYGRGCVFTIVTKLRASHDSDWTRCQCQSQPFVIFSLHHMQFTSLSLPTFKWIRNPQRRSQVMLCLGTWVVLQNQQLWPDLSLRWIIVCIVVFQGRAATLRSYLGAQVQQRRASL